jgi:hypothetical protein
MFTTGINAKFLNDYFGAIPADAGAESSLIAMACPQAERKKIASGYLGQKFAAVSKQIDSAEVVLNNFGKEQIVNARKFISKGQLDVYAYLGALFNHSAAPFKKLFEDFGGHLATGVDQTSKMIATTGGKMTPLPRMLEAGVDSAVHIWEAVLKSLLVKQGPNINIDQFKKAYEKSKELLLDITDIPLQVLATLESYLFKREKAYHLYTAADQASERMGSKVRHEAINYDQQTGALNLDQKFMSSDPALTFEKAKLDRVADESHYKIHSCAGKQMIPLLFKYMDQIFEEHLFPYFDNMVKNGN